MWAPQEDKVRTLTSYAARPQGEEAAGQLRGLWPRPDWRAEPEEEAQAAGGRAGRT